MPNKANSVVLTLTCINTPAIQVSFEPDGAQHELKQGDSFGVEISATELGDAEISYLPDGLIVGAWSSAKTRAWNRAGNELAL